MTHSLKVLSPLAVTLILASCAGTPERNTALEEARNSVDQAQGDPAVNQYAAVEAQKAEEQLQKAESLWKAGKPGAEVTHAAYLAKQRAAIAEQKAKMGLAEEEIQSAQAKRDEIRLQAQTRKIQSAETSAAMHQQTAEKLQQQVRELQAKETERGIVLTLGDVLFDTDKAVLKSGAYPTIAKLSEFLDQYKKRSVLIEGFTDSRGTQEYNQQLSERRANAVRDALVERGIDPQRIRVRGYGEAYPVASNAKAQGRQQNRRVEIIISDPDGQIQERR